MSSDPEKWARQKRDWARRTYRLAHGIPLDAPLYSTYRRASGGGVDREKAAELREKGYTLQQVANFWGVSRQAIHQLLARTKSA